MSTRSTSPLRVHEKMYTSTQVQCTLTPTPALDTAIPLYLIHKGKRLTEDVKVRSTPRCAFNISCSGCSASEQSENYAKTKGMVKEL